MSQGLIFIYTFLPIISWWEGMWARILDRGFSPCSVQVGKTEWVTPSWSQRELKVILSCLDRNLTSTRLKLNPIHRESSWGGGLCLAGALKRKGSLEQIAPPGSREGEHWWEADQVSVTCEWVFGCSGHTEQFDTLKASPASVCNPTSLALN